MQGFLILICAFLFLQKTKGSQRSPDHLWIDLFSCVIVVVMFIDDRHIIQR